MKPIWSITGGVLALILSYSLAWAQDPAIVFVDEAKAGAKSIMVMDADGSNRTEIFRTGKRFCDCGGPTLSPSISPLGDWVTFVFAEDASYDIHRITTSGSDHQVLLCGENPDNFVVLETPQWSPDGTEVAVQLSDLFQGGPTQIVIVPSLGIQPCPYDPAELEIVYPVQTVSPDLHIFQGIAWSPDGSQMAFLEDADSNWHHRLTIVDRVTKTAIHHEIEWPTAFLSDGSWLDLAALDWRRSEESGQLVFAFDTYTEGAYQGDTLWLLTVEGDVAVATELAKGQSPTWSPGDSSQLLFGSSQGLTRVTFNPSSTELLGSGYDPDWQRVALDLNCSISGCDDGNPCTEDICDTQTGACSNPSSVQGTTCDDANECTEFDVCDGTGQCQGSALADDTTCNLGNGICCAGACSSATCESDIDCGDSNGCTFDSCFNPNTCAAYCVNDPEPNCPVCLNRGAKCTANDQCCSGSCHPIKGTCK